MTTKPKYPLKKDLESLVKSVKKCIDKDCRAFEFDDSPSIQLTIGWNKENGQWDYQTGDNSYSGGAYHYPIWSVVGVYPKSSSKELAKDILSQLSEQVY